MISQDINTMMYYYDTVNYVNSKLVLYPGNLTNMARILVQLTLLVGTDACTLYTVNSV